MGDGRMPATSWGARVDFVDALRVLARRWIVVLVGAVLTAGMGFYAIQVVETEYQARAQYLLLLPSGATGETRGNPLVNLNGGLVFAASLIAADVSSVTVARELADDGFTSEYSIAAGTSGGPVLDLMVTGTDADDVLSTRDELLRRFDEKLGSLQDLPGVPKSQLIFSRTNAVDPVAEAVPGAKRQALIIIAGVGMVLTLAAAFTLDRVRRRRSPDHRHASDPTTP